MNILQIQSALTKLDDNQLKQEMLSPGMAPQFLVLSEMQRRQEIRRGGQKGPPPPQTTLKDEAMAQTGAPPPPPPQGIAALPEGAETAQGVQGFAGGGAVSGGRYFVRDGVAYDLEALSDQERQQLLSGHDITAGAPGSPATLGPARSRDELLPAYFRDRVPPSETYVPPDPNSILQGGLLPPYFNNRTRPVEEPSPGSAYRQREADITAAGRAPYQPAMAAGTLDAQSAEAGGAPVAPPSGRSQWGLTGTGMSSRYPSTAGARNLSDEASGRPVGLPALAAARAPDEVPETPRARRSDGGSGPVPDISSISDRDLLSYWRSFQPSQLGIRSAASSPFSLTEIEMERARRAPAGSRPVTSNQQFAGTGEEGSVPRPAPIVTASGTTPRDPEAAPGSTPRQSQPETGLPSLRNRPSPSEVDAALAAMPKYPATRTAALIESGLGANTDHGGSFKGILGIGKDMWKDYRDRLGLKESDRENPEAQRRVYESFTEDQRKLNPKATDADVYTAWAMGPAAARAARNAPDADAYATYARLTSKDQADKAFSTNPGLLQLGRSNADTLAAYRGRYALAERGDIVPAGRGPDGTEIRVAPPGSGAAAVAGNSKSPVLVPRTDSGDTPDFDQSLRRARSALPDRLAGSEDEARQLFGGSAAEHRKDAVNLGLMEAGLRIMGSTSPRLAGAISEGGIAGLQTYRQGLEAARKDEKEGFGARMGIAAARAHQDDAAVRAAGQLYGTDSQAATARGNNATQLAAANLTGQYSLAGHQVTADTQREVANINAGVHREGYDRSDPLRVAEWVMAAPTPEEYQRRLQASGRDRLGLGGGTHDHQLIASFNTEDSRLRDDFRLKKEDQFLSPEQKAAKQQDLDRQYKAARQELIARYARLSPTAFGADVQAAPAAPAAPVGAYDPTTRSIVR
jgi:hypothetical protein